jgi:predicted  nucleic acid-binding Zn-ribbon protein
MPTENEQTIICGGTVREDKGEKNKQILELDKKIEKLKKEKKTLEEQVEKDKPQLLQEEHYGN